MFRIGFGYDVHQLKNGLKLWIGGIEVPHYKGEVAHSDGDVLLHAICDAMLGALALRDIGFHFPDTSENFKGIDSKILLKNTYKLITDKKYILGNLDATICLQKPKIAEFIPQMIECISQILDQPIENISIKATTTEKLGFVGTEDGISAYCVVLLTKE